MCWVSITGEWGEGLKRAGESEMEGWKDRKTESHFVYFILGKLYFLGKLST